MARPRAQRTKIRAELKIGEAPHLNRHWRDLFLGTLAETSNVSEAARKAGVNPGRAYKVRRDEPAFRQSWYEALLEGYEHLEMETLYRLRNGAGEGDKKFDIANALRLLAMHRDTVARHRAARDEVSEESVLKKLNAKIEEIRQREAKMLEDKSGNQ